MVPRPAMRDHASHPRALNRRSRRRLLPEFEPLERRQMLTAGTARLRSMELLAETAGTRHRQALQLAAIPSVAARRTGPQSVAVSAATTAAFRVPGTAGQMVRLTLTLTERSARYRNEV